MGKQSVSNGSVHSAQNRTSFSIEAYLAIPFARWGAKPHIVHPVPFPEALVADSTVEKVLPKPPVHPLKQALEWQAMLAANPSLNRADIARINGISRARVSQVMKLLDLDSTILEFVKDLSEPREMRFFSDRRLRAVAEQPSRDRQREIFVGLVQDYQSTE